MLWTSLEQLLFHNTWNTLIYILGETTHPFPFLPQYVHVLSMIFSVCRGSTTRAGNLFTPECLHGIRWLPWLELANVTHGTQTNTPHVLCNRHSVDFIGLILICLLFNNQWRFDCSVDVLQYERAVEPAVYLCIIPRVPPGVVALFWHSFCLHFYPGAEIVSRLLTFVTKACF